MTKPIIAIDVDDVLADNAAGFVAYTNKKWDTNLTVDDYDEHWANVWKVDLNETERRAVEFLADAPRHFTHSEAALPVLRKLAETYELIIVTSRRVSMTKDTLEWIHRHYPGVFKDESIHFAGIWDKGVTDHGRFNATKGDIIKSLGANYLIDDQLKHCLAASEHGIDAILFGNYAWNQSDALPANITRAHDWAAVEAYFDAK